MFRARLPHLALALALLAPLSACTSRGDGSPDVAASFYPLAWVAEQIVGDHATVENLTHAGQEPHDVELTVRQVADVASATIAFYSSGFQPGVDEAVAQADGVRVVDVNKVVHLEPPHDEGDHGHDHGHEGLDPHFWLDPTRLAAAADGFARAMAEEDPEHKADYERNARKLQASLTTLDREFHQGLAECRTRTIIVSHDAFGYLGERYDLHVVPIAGISPDAEPSAKALAAVRTEAEHAGVTTVFSERLASPALADTLAHELGVTTAVLDPLEGLAKGDTGDYLSIMRANLSALQTANGCS